LSDTKPGKAATVVEPCLRFTPAEAARNKKNRDERRKAIRDQNARSKTMR
jgi:hypothetical protein